MMSLQSLCSAIRSQLYFSQIVAWSEQLNNLAFPLPIDVINNPRIVKSNQGKTAKLDIFFRIRQYNEDSDFSEKPLEHQFPDANLTDTISIQIYLKSLPRQSSIPVVTGKCEALASSKNLMLEKKINICTEKGKHRCHEQEESSSKEECKFSNNFPVPSLEHREKQLQKYRRRILKREKNKRKNDSGGKSDDSSDNQLISTVSSNDVIKPILNNKTTQTMTTCANNVGTQTDDFEFSIGCTQYENLCNIRQPICPNCDNQQKCRINTSVNIHDNNPLEKAEILLQALERTASVNSKRQKESIYKNVHEIIKRQKCCQNYGKKVSKNMLFL